MLENRSISIRLSKKDIKMLQELQVEFGETQTNVIKHALHMYYHLTKGEQNV